MSNRKRSGSPAMIPSAEPDTSAKNKTSAATSSAAASSTKRALLATSTEWRNRDRSGAPNFSKDAGASGRPSLITDSEESKTASSPSDRNGDAIRATPMHRAAAGPPPHPTRSPATKNVASAQAAPSSSISASGKANPPVGGNTRIKGPWTRDEDELLAKLVKEFGPKKWSVIASHVPGRIGKQCRERWLNHLDASVKKSPWSDAEDAVLLEAQERIGNRWCEIAKMLPGRPENAVKNRWNSLMNRRYPKYSKSAAPSASPGGPSASRHVSPSGGMVHLHPPLAPQQHATPSMMMAGPQGGHMSGYAVQHKYAPSSSGSGSGSSSSASSRRKSSTSRKTSPANTKHLASRATGSASPTAPVVSAAAPAPEKSAQHAGGRGPTRRSPRTASGPASSRSEKSAVDGGGNEAAPSAKERKRPPPALKLSTSELNIFSMSPTHNQLGGYPDHPMLTPTAHGTPRSVSSMFDRFAAGLGGPGDGDLLGSMDLDAVAAGAAGVATAVPPSAHGGEAGSALAQSLVGLSIDEDFKDLLGGITLASTPRRPQEGHAQENPAASAPSSACRASSSSRLGNIYSSCSPHGVSPRGLDLSLLDSLQLNDGFSFPASTTSMAASDFNFDLSTPRLTQCQSPVAKLRNLSRFFDEATA